MEQAKKAVIKYRAYLIIFAVVLLLEVFVFNCKAFSLIGGGYDALSLPAQTAASVTGEITEDGVKGSNGSIILEYKGINCRVKTIYIDMELSGNIIEKKVDVDYKDATYSSGYRYPWTESEINIINGNNRSQYMTLNVSGDVSDIKIKVNLGEDESAVIRSVGINRPVPFRFSIVRFLILFLLICGIYVLAASSVLQKNYEDNKLLCGNVFAVMTVAVILLMYFFTYIGNTSGNYSLFETLGGVDSGNQISKEIVDAFEAGQVSLLKEPSDTMLSLENPYDYSQRIAAGVNSEAWDHCLYNGRYYSYYGVGPVLTLFLPFHKLTGYYFSTAWAVLLYGIVGVIFLSMLYEGLVRRFFGKVRSNIIIMGHFMIMVSSGIFFSVIRPMFYEIAIASAFAAVAAGFYFMITANVIGGGEIKYSRLALSTACLGFAVLCRPTTAVYCVASLAFIWFGFRKLIKEEKVKSLKNRCSYFICALVPYVAFGGFQMWYNYARFDSPLDFGIKYSLTINDFTATEFHVHFAVISFFAFLFAVPQIIPNFPYVSGEFSKLNLNGFYFVDDSGTKGLAIGALFRALPLFSYLLSFKALKKLEKGKRLIPSVLIILTCIIAPFAIIFSTWESGFAVRYFADFSWQILTGALAIAFFLFGKCKNEGVKRIAEVAFIVMTALCLIVNAGQIYNFLKAAAQLSGFISEEWECRILAFSRLFDFWI